MFMIGWPPSCAVSTSKLAPAVTPKLFEFATLAMFRLDCIGPQLNQWNGFWKS